LGKRALWGLPPSGDWYQGIQEKNSRGKNGIREEHGHRKVVHDKERRTEDESSRPEGRERLRDSTNWSFPLLKGRPKGKGKGNWG